MNIVLRINRIILFSSLTVYALTFTPCDNYKRVTDPDPLLFSQPLQSAASVSGPFDIVRNGYIYKITPLYDYEVSGLVVSKMDYSLFNKPIEKIFTIDLALIWGNNVRNGVYRKKTIRFYQDMRWGFVEWGEPVDFDFNGFSNNHLVIDRPEILSKAKLIDRGDQVRIKGALISMDAVPAKAGKGNGDYFSDWRSSAQRGDQGAFSCEIIYVKDIETIKRVSPLRVVLHRVSGYVSILTILIWAVLFFSLPATI